MSNPVIQVENLSKYYRLGLIGGGTLKEDIYRWVAKMRGKPDPLLMPGDMDHDTRKDGQIWALRDVNMEVNEGEILGIIGRNGAGKSTLLKILSKITAPTQGGVKIKGRVGSLLEVGTGFHPELTGRENTYLNGTILGMSHSEVTSKLEEIVEFAEMSKFIDTPVKRYSSGMRVRLAFAVAAHLEPEILIIDEVLAVGDIAFQKKCLGKMDEASKQHGRTVLFVSHNMQTIRALCSRAVVLDAGSVIADGPVFEAVDIYNSNLFDRDFSSTTSVSDETVRRGSGAVRFSEIKMLDTKDNERQIFKMGEVVHFKFSYEVFKNIQCLYLHIAFRSGKMGEVVTSLRHRVSGKAIKKGAKKSVELEIPELNFRPGEYELYCWLGNQDKPFDIVDGLLPPLVVYAEGHKDDLGFNPSQSVGFFNMSSVLIRS
ncbi:ABC transporter ATP-binding protein [Desulfosarcina sp.]|nr:ABC transporter ATP-binding protein [Desulfosarcina sp.]